MTFKSVRVESLTNDPTLARITDVESGRLLHYVERVDFHLEAQKCPRLILSLVGPEFLFEAVPELRGVLTTLVLDLRAEANSLTRERSSAELLGRVGLSNMLHRHADAVETISARAIGLGMAG